jgi:diadenylate cyclase
MIDLFKIGFLTVTLIDLIDITIVTIFFYWLYQRLRDTIAVNVLFGLVIVIALSFITEAVNLKSINWILRTISDIWLIAFIVLFQPEIRKLLMIISRSKIFRSFVQTKIGETIDEVVDAVKELSEKHIGALIVFPRSQNVQMTIDTGVRLQATLTKELILSIFNVKSPLHDGAIIVENNIIVAARCILPLSQQTKFKGRNLGTRHRAALGLSEQIDAIVLVVSEETGSISIADSGELSLNISIDNLAGVLSTKLAD